METPREAVRKYIECKAEEELAHARQLHELKMEHERQFHMQRLKNMEELHALDLEERRLRIQLLRKELREDE